MPRFRALVAYDGSAYNGFQRQLDQPTIQGELEQAIEKIARQPVTVIGAGRTDSGVHALGQVVAFDLDWSHGEDALLRALNVNLPKDIVIQELTAAAPRFHPRFDARRRAYFYNIYNHKVPHPHYRNQSWHVIRPLNLERMNEAAVSIIGEHDFATFGQPPQGENTVRYVYSAEWQQKEPFLTFTIEANAFLYRMVRSLVGSMKLVGDGTWTVEAFLEALAAKDRSRAGQTAPPQALFLESVSYEE
jgi:tRNA pseudouridine38-40 synthase